MGYYINSTPSGTPLPVTGKAAFLSEDVSVTELLAAPKEWHPGIVCVIVGGAFDAAGWCYSPAELDAFADPTDTRRKRWFIVPWVSQLFPHVKE